MYSGGEEHAGLFLKMPWKWMTKKQELKPTANCWFECRSQTCRSPGKIQIKRFKRVSIPFWWAGVPTPRKQWVNREAKRLWLPPAKASAVTVHPHRAGGRFVCQQGPGESLQQKWNGSNTPDCTWAYKASVPRCIPPVVAPIHKLLLILTF